MTNYFDGDYFDGDYFDTPTGASAQTITPTGVESAETFGSATLTGGAAQQSVTPTSITSTGAVGTPQINQHIHGTCPVQEYTGANLTKHGIIIERGGSGAFDENLVESPVVWYDENEEKYGMVYVAYSSGTVVASVGLAWSTDLLSWTKDPASPIFERSLIDGSPDENGITGPYIHYEDGTYYLFYIGLTDTGYEGGTKTLNLATSDNIYGPWTRYENNPIIAPKTGTWRNVAIWHPNIIKEGDTYYLFFNASNSTTEHIGYASSTDLYTWTVDDVNSPILTPGAPGSWEDVVIGDPSVYKVGDTWYMAYYGYDGSHAYDGIATTSEESFPLGWTKYEDNPVLSPSEAYDSTFAHKPFIYVTSGGHYHYYTAVGTGGRRIALTTEPAVPCLDAGIVSSETLGTPQLNFTIYPGGIASGETFGSLTITTGAEDQTITITEGITSGEALGTPKLTLYITPSGIGSGEATGSPQFNFTIHATGAGSAETFGTAKLKLYITPSGVSSDEDFGTPTTILYLKPNGIETGEGLGNPQLNFIIHPIGIISGENVGTPDLIYYQLIQPPGIPSSEEFGLIILRPDQFITIPGMASGEEFGEVVIWINHTYIHVTADNTYPDTVAVLTFPVDVTVESDAYTTSDLTYPSTVAGHSRPRTLAVTKQ